MMQTISAPFLFPTCLLLVSSTLFCPVRSAGSPKRGLVYVTPDKPSDDSIWTRADSDLTWYYNYLSTPTAALSSAAHLSFVPMLWGAPSSPTSTDTTFLDSITGQLSRRSSSDAGPDNNNNNNLTHVLAYNEPDGSTSTGGANLSPDAAANTWLRNLRPLRDRHGLKVGLPAVTGSERGIRWLESFNASCQVLNPGDGCAADFVPVHWYGDFEGLASHIGHIRALYPALPLWITEYALPNADLVQTHRFYNSSAEYLDRLDHVHRYSYFGAFRSHRSNVGPNPAFLTPHGHLTDIGSWYLGGVATGNLPTAAAAPASARLGSGRGASLAWALSFGTVISGLGWGCW